MQRLLRSLYSQMEGSDDHIPCFSHHGSFPKVALTIEELQKNPALSFHGVQNSMHCSSWQGDPRCSRDISEELCAWQALLSEVLMY